MVRKLRVSNLHLNKEVSMSDWVYDTKELQTKFGVFDAIRKMDACTLKSFLEYRKDFLQEELDELSVAIHTKNGDDVVDAMIDLCVVAIDTLNALGVDSNKAWDEVYRANISKSVGVNTSRPNPLGLPDLVKPVDFKKPNHTTNTGLLATCLV